MMQATVVIVTLFLAALLDVSAARQIAGLFIIAMLALVGGLLAFLQRIFVATASIGIDPPQDRVTAMLREAS